MKIRIQILVIFLLTLFSVKAQNEKTKNSPKIGLVLSGGGAKGLSHIGVLKVIDSLGINIDYVSGTSMGSIIGALYASGYSGKQLDSIFHEIDFQKIINDDLPRHFKAFYERDNSEKYALTLPFDNLKIKLPSAISRGQNAYNLFSRLTFHVSDIKDFDLLPIPFFCIATNVETGNQVVLEEGNLTQSIMASSALPTLFQPVIINGDMLIDGGVENNYPIDELRDKGMDIIIGVDVQDGLLVSEELTSAPDILIQVNNFRAIKAMKAKINKTDIYIKPDIKKFSVFSFDEGTSIIDYGKQAALLKSKALKALPKSDGKIKKGLTKFEFQDSLRINTFTFNGEHNYSRAYLLGKLKLKLKEKIGYRDFENGINNLIATNNFDSFQYELNKNENKESYNLLANVRESKTTTFLKLGIHYDDLYKSAALVNFTKKRLFFSNDVASLDFVLGDHVRYNFEYLIDKGFYWSIGLNSRYNTFKRNINAKLLLDESEMSTIGINKIDTEFQDQSNQFYLQTLLRKNFALRIGLEHKRLEIKSETILSANPNEDYAFENTDYFSAFSTLKLDSYDNKYFPKKGVYINGDVHIYFSGSSFNKNFENFSIVQSTLGHAFSATNKLSFNLQTGFGFKLGNKSTQSLDFALGGYGNNFINNFIPFIGYDFISLAGNSYIKTAIIGDYEVLKKHHITFEANWANIGDDIFETGAFFKLPEYGGYGLGYAIETFVGPIQVKYSFSPELSEGVWFFNLGFWF